MRLRSSLSLPQAATLLHGDLIHGGASVIRSAAVDTRSMDPDGLFFALPGSHADGSLYLEEAGRAGAVCAVVNRKWKERAVSSSLPCILVDDPLSSLWAFSHAQAAPYGKVRYVGVTGSCGKTTTKDAIAAILSKQGKTVKTPGNLNSEIGLPLSVLQVGADTEYGVFEMGVDHEAEMSHMLSVVKPEVSVLTNIGISHLEKFGNQEAIAHEKGQIFHRDVHAGFIASGSPFIRQIEREQHILLRQYGPEELYAIDRGLAGYDILLSGRLVPVHAVGRHMLTDIAGAIQVARFMGVDEEVIAEGLEHFTPLEGRGTVLGGDVTIIEDCYNASLDSTNSMLDYMAHLSWNGKKKVALGTMKELGSESVYAHEMVAEKILRSGISGTFLYGNEMKTAFDVLKRNRYEGLLSFTDDFEELKEKVTGSVEKGDLFLLKGSRSMAMERLIPAIRNVG
jgi:UDP-N-acetylmuramoyl-tripeptide--D-alanyl-D-alanine ligase